MTIAAWQSTTVLVTKSFVEEILDAGSKGVGACFDLLPGGPGLGFGGLPDLLDFLAGEFCALNHVSLLRIPYAFGRFFHTLADLLGAGFYLLSRRTDR